MIRTSVGLAGVFALLLTTVILAQPPGGPGAGPGARGPGGFGFGGFGGGSVDLLLREDVQRELELLPSQVAELREAVEGMRGELRDLFAQVQDVPREQRAQRLRELGEDLRADVDSRVDQVLLPHQSRRLQQLANQMRMRGGATRGMLNPTVAEELGLSEADQERLRARAEQVEARLRQQMADLRRQAQEELLQTLTPQQQAKWREMVGEPFEFQRDERPMAAFGQPGRRPGGGGERAEASGDDAPRRRPGGQEGRGFGARRR